MTKLTENSFRDVNLAFANELSILCDDMDIDVKELISLANKHLESTFKSWLWCRRSLFL